MGWQQIGIPSIVVILSGLLFVWYKRINDSSISNLKLIIDRLESEKKGLESKNKELQDKVIQYENIQSQQEVEKTAEREKILEIVNYFDRGLFRRIHRFGIMENAWSEDGPTGMCISFEELRVQIQKTGISTIRDDFCRELFNDIRDDIYTILSIMHSLALNASHCKLRKDEIFLFKPSSVLEVTYPIFGDDNNHNSPLKEKIIDELQEHFNPRIIKIIQDRNESDEIAEQENIISEEILKILSFTILYVYAFGFIDCIRQSITKRIEMIKSKYL